MSEAQKSVMEKLEMMAPVISDHDRGLIEGVAIGIGMRELSNAGGVEDDRGSKDDDPDAVG